MAGSITSGTTVPSRWLIDSISVHISGGVWNGWVLYLAIILIRCLCKSIDYLRFLQEEEYMSNEPIAKDYKIILTGFSWQKCGKLFSGLKTEKHKYKLRVIQFEGLDSLDFY